jgi:RNA polymerase sigma-70 factor (ECF subfamily)
MVLPSRFPDISLPHPIELQYWRHRIVEPEQRSARVSEGAEDQHAIKEAAALLRAAAGGDAAAWRELVGMYGRRLFALAKSRCRNDDVAEDITQSVFATVAAKFARGEYHEQGRFEQWLFRIAMNRIRDHARKSRRSPEIRGNHDLDRAGPEPVMRSDAVMLERLRHAMDHLPESDREVMALRHHGGLSFKQISELLEEPLGTLLARHHRALKKLKDILDEPAQAGDRPQEVLS